MAISIESLHIGSHVLLVDNEIAPGIAYLEKGLRYKVTGIDSFNNLISLGDKYEERYGIKHALSFNPDHLDPIPITEELLTELGFEEYPHTPFGFDVAYDYIDKDGHTLIEVANRKGNAEWRVQGVGWTRVHYLHELEAFVYLTTKQRLI